MLQLKKKKSIKIDPKKIKKEDLQNVFSNVLSKLKLKSWPYCGLSLPQAALKKRGDLGV